jgi:hypothetical protein
VRFLLPASCLGINGLVSRAGVDRSQTTLVMAVLGMYACFHQSMRRSLARYQPLLYRLSNLPMLSVVTDYIETLRSHGKPAANHVRKQADRYICDVWPRGCDVAATSVHGPRILC